MKEGLQENDFTRGYPKFNCSNCKYIGIRYNPDATWKNRQGEIAKAHWICLHPEWTSEFRLIQRSAEIFNIEGEPKDHICGAWGSSEAEKRNSIIEEILNTDEK